jgi:hypothetical protein
MLCQMPSLVLNLVLARQMLYLHYKVLLVEHYPIRISYIAALMITNKLSII